MSAPIHGPSNGARRKEARQQYHQRKRSQHNPFLPFVRLHLFALGLSLTQTHVVQVCRPKRADVYEVVLVSDFLSERTLRGSAHLDEFFKPKGIAAVTDWPALSYPRAARPC